MQGSLTEVFKFGILSTMNRNFFVRLAFAVHRVADALPQEEQIAEEIREAASTILADLIVFVDKEVVKIEKKRDILLRLKKQIELLVGYLDRAKEEDWVNPENFSLLKEEYGNIQEFLEIFEGISFSEEKIVLDSEVEDRGSREQGKESPKESIRGSDNEAEVPLPVSTIPSKVPDKSVLTQRQKRIIDFLRTKQDAQVWELQKILPEVTKRTLRRDLDELLQKNLVERKGEWNAVAYELK